MTDLEEKALQLIMALYPPDSEAPESHSENTLPESGNSPDLKSLPYAQMHFIDKLTFASESELRSFVEKLWTDSFSMLPVWARNLAHRLLCLQCPDDPDVLASAAADWFTHGPDWDAEAEHLKAKAKQLRSALP